MPDRRVKKKTKVEIPAYRSPLKIFMDNDHRKKPTAFAFSGMKMEHIQHFVKDEGFEKFGEDMFRRNNRYVVINSAFMYPGMIMSPRTIVAGKQADWYEIGNAIMEDNAEVLVQIVSMPVKFEWLRKNRNFTKGAISKEMKKSVDSRSDAKQIDMTTREKGTRHLSSLLIRKDSATYYDAETTSGCEDRKGEIAWLHKAVQSTMKRRIVGKLGLRGGKGQQNLIPFLKFQPAPSKLDIPMQCVVHSLFLLVQFLNGHHTRMDLYASITTHLVFYAKICHYFGRDRRGDVYKNWEQDIILLKFKHEKLLNKLCSGVEMTERELKAALLKTGI